MNDHVQKAARQLNSPADLDLMSNPTVCGTQQKGAEIKLEALKDKQLKRLIDYKVDITKMNSLKSFKWDFISMKNILSAVGV